jgi:RNA polymerase sigma-70 factor (ECF subfamily)
MARSPTEDDIRRIYRETLDDLYGFVARRCDGDRALAEDVTQETWLRAVRSWRDDGLPDRPLAWLATVAARLLSNHFRRPVMQRLDDDAGDTRAAHDTAANDAAADDFDDSRSLLQRAFARLPLPQVRLLEAFHYDQRAVADIAAAAGLSERAVEGRLRRARQNLRRQIDADADNDGERS